MKDKLVLDASMSLAWIFNRHSSEEIERAERALYHLDEVEIWVPALWYTENANTLVVLERRNLVNEAQISAYLNKIFTLEVNIDLVTPQELCYRIIASAREHKLTAYDATYLDLALRLNATLATFDQQLAKAMLQAGGKVFE